MIKFNKTEFTKSINFKRKLPVELEKRLYTLLSKFKNRAEYELCDTAYYRPINEAIQNNSKKIYGKSIALSISQDEANNAQHILEVSMLHPTMMLEVKRPLAYGDKKTIMNFLNNENSIKILKEDIKQMSEKLQTR